MAIFNGTRSATTAQPRVIEKGPFRLDREKRQGTYKGRPLELSAINFDYLWTLVSNAPDPVSNERLVAESLGKHLATTDVNEATRWRIRQLRQELESDPQRPRRLLAVPGYGYRLEV
jgi:DNA-binding response OmpR family regulator